MGILGFYSWVSPICNVQKNQSVVYSLSIDLNSLLHDTLKQIVENLVPIRGIGKEDSAEDRKRFLRKLKPEQFIEIYTDLLISNIENVISTVNPQKYILIVIDGVCPLSKMSQQRKRRYFADSSNIPDSIFKSNQISPGTLFMKTVENSISKWIETYQSRATIVFSPSQIKGEGEHKIFDIFRRGLVGIESLQSDENYHYFYSKDSDMYMLLLVFPLRNTFIYNDRRAEMDRAVGYKLLSIEMLRNYIVENLDVDYPVHSFVFSTMLLGNDFVQSLRMFRGHTKISTKGFVVGDFDKSIKILFSILESNQINLVQSDLSIRATAVGELFSALAKIEKQTIESVKDSTPSHAEQLSLLSHQKAEKTNQDWFSIFETEYYRMILCSYKKELREIPVDRKDVVLMSVSYIKTLLWAYNYYVAGQGEVCWDHWYDFNSTPLVQDLAVVSQSLIKKHLLNGCSLNIYRSSQLINPTVIHQHLIIFPPSSMHVACNEAKTIFNGHRHEAMFAQSIGIVTEDTSYDYHVDLFCQSFSLQRVDTLVKREVGKKILLEIDIDPKETVKISNFAPKPYKAKSRFVNDLSVPVKISLPLDINLY